MSAWIVPRVHIDVLVQALINEGVIGFDEGDRVGGQLWSENHYSVNCRYGERTKRPPYRFEPFNRPLNDAVVFKAISCFDYQCMEYDGYDRKPGIRKLHKLKARMIERLHIEPFTDDYGRTDDGSWRWADQRLKDGGLFVWPVERRKDAVA
jgi:hypothetical protein